MNGAGTRGLCCGWERPQVPADKVGDTENKVAYHSFHSVRLLMHLR